MKKLTSAVVKMMAFRGGVVISKSPKKTQGVLVMYVWVNIQHQWLLHHNVRRVRRPGKGGGGGGGVESTIYNFPLCSFFFDGDFPVGSTCAMRGWKRRRTKQKVHFSFLKIIKNNRK